MRHQLVTHPQKMAKIKMDWRWAGRRAKRMTKSADIRMRNRFKEAATKAGWVDMSEDRVSPPISVKEYD